jgi:hypothetical protein
MHAMVLCRPGEALQAKEVVRPCAGPGLKDGLDKDTLIAISYLDGVVDGLFTDSHAHGDYVDVTIQ